MIRCEWGNKSLLYQQYHDEEWGVPVHDDRTLFEFLMLEGAQAGLSWETILKKRDGYREAFDQFNAKKYRHIPKQKLKDYCKIPKLSGTDSR
jgi:DNA-3-methyladenine glycosylase I